MLKWEGERSAVRAENERPSSCKVGGGSLGGGGTLEGKGDEGLREMSFSKLEAAGGGSSLMVARAGPSRRWIKLLKNPESLLEDLDWRKD